MALSARVGSGTGTSGRGRHSALGREGGGALAGWGEGQDEGPERVSDDGCSPFVEVDSVAVQVEAAVVACAVPRPGLTLIRSGLNQNRAVRPSEIVLRSAVRLLCTSATSIR